MGGVGSREPPPPLARAKRSGSSASPPSAVKQPRLTRGEEPAPPPRAPHPVALPDVFLPASPAGAPPFLLGCPHLAAYTSSPSPSHAASSPPPSADPSPPSLLSALPLDVLLLVLFQLPAADLAASSLTCRLLHHAAARVLPARLSHLCSCLPPWEKLTTSLLSRLEHDLDLAPSLLLRLASDEANAAFANLHDAVKLHLLPLTLPRLLALPSHHHHPVLCSVLPDGPLPSAASLVPHAPAFLSLLHHDHEGVRYLAANALLSIPPLQLAPYACRFEAALRGGGRVRRVALRTVEAMPPHALLPLRGAIEAIRGETGEDPALRHLACVLAFDLRRCLKERLP